MDPPDAATTTVVPRRYRAASAAAKPGGAASARVVVATRAPGARAVAVISKVLVIVEENHSLAQMREGMPYLYGVARRYGYASDYRAARHPSLPNYLAISGGSTFGVSDDELPAAHRLRGLSVFGEAISAGRTARLYAESLPSPCATTNVGDFVARHAPWAYYVDERAVCDRGEVPAGTTAGGALATDITAGRLPAVGMLVPNLLHDAHDGTLRQADTWLEGWLPTLMGGPDFMAGRLVIVVTADEDDYTAVNKVLTVVIAPDVHHRVITAPLNHYALTRLYDNVAELPLLREAAGAASIATDFGLHLRS